MSYRKVTDSDRVKLDMAWRENPQEPRLVSRATGVGWHTSIRYRPADLPPLRMSISSPSPKHSIKKVKPALRRVVEKRVEAVHAEAQPEPPEKVVAPESTIDAPDAADKQENRLLAIGRINASNLSAGAAVVSGLMKKSTHQLYKKVDQIDDPHELVDILYKLSKMTRELATASKTLIEGERIRRNELPPTIGVGVNVNVEHGKIQEVGAALQALEDVTHVYELAKRRKEALAGTAIDVTPPADGDAS